MAAVLGGFCLVGAGTCLYIAGRNEHMAKMIKEAPYADLDDLSLIDSLKKEGKPLFLKIKGQASTGPSEPVRLNGVDQPLAFSRIVVHSRSLTSPLSPVGFHKEVTKPTLEYSETQPLTMGIETKGVFVEKSSQIPIENNDLLLSKEVEKPAGSKYISSLAAIWGLEYPYANVIQLKTLPVGSRILATGNVTLTKSQAQPILLQSNPWDTISPRPTPTIYTTKTEEEWIQRYDRKAFQLKLASAALGLGAVACAAAFGINRREE